MVSSIEQIGNTAPVQPADRPSRPVEQRGPGSGRTFADVLNKTVVERGELKISQHAQERLQRRNIQLTGEEFHKIEKAVETAREKGAKESLVLLDNMAFVVSVKNRVIVTAMEKQAQAQRVFTNIDSVVLA